MVLHRKNTIKSSKKKERLLDRGLEYFLNKRYFEAHEEWEMVWLKEKDPQQKTLIKVMIQIAGVEVLMSKKRSEAALRLWKSLKRHFSSISQNSNLKKLNKKLNLDLWVSSAVKELKSK